LRAAKKYLGAKGSEASVWANGGVAEKRDKISERFHS